MRLNLGNEDRGWTLDVCAPTVLSFCSIETSQEAVTNIELNKEQARELAHFLLEWANTGNKARRFSRTDVIGQNGNTGEHYSFMKGGEHD